MTVRVRKLAKELQRTPAELLGILHSLGFDRYRSPEDMIADPVEQKLRWAVRRGVRADPVEPERERRERPPERVAAGPMASIVPGVVRQVDERFVGREEPRRPAARAAPVDRSRVAFDGAAGPDLDPAGAPCQTSPIGGTPVEERVLAAERSAIAAERQALAAERAALEAERAAWKAQRESRARVPLAELLSERGLVGADESERALRALAEARRLVELIPWLEVSDPVEAMRWLKDVLVLVDGAPHPALATEPCVAVAPERAEVPGAAAWTRLAGQLSERLLLHGARRVVVVGGSPRGHRLLRLGLDPRIEFRFRPARAVVAADAEADVTRTDAVVLWNVSTDPAADAIYAGGRALVARVESDGLRAFVEEWIRALSR